MTLSSNERIVDALRLTDQKSQLLLTDLNGQSAAFSGSNRRNRGRLPWDLRQSATATIQSPGGTLASFLVKPRNISREGMAFLHGGFVYPQSACTMTLRDLHDEETQLHGRVMRCHHVRGHVHEVGVRFDQPVVLARFVVIPSGSHEADGADELRARLISEFERLIQLVETEMDMAHLRQRLSQVIQLIDAAARQAAAPRPVNHSA